MLDSSIGAKAPRAHVCSLLGILALATVASACAASDDDRGLWRPEATRAARGAEVGDVCAPGAAPELNDAPLGTCASAVEYHVPDLTVAARRGTGTLAARAIRPLDAPVDPAGAAAPPALPSCATGGPGRDTCGPNGNESCCRIATVPGGKAATLDVATFDLGVYEVTSGRFARFVTAAGGDLRSLAANAKWTGWRDKWTAKLPASRAAVNDELGPSCKFRSDVRNFGALTWPSDDIEAAVASLITDDNDRAADIRADAKPARLHQKPINCVSYWMAAAFCAWDGGRLPSSDEWTYAAMGGDELRDYAWPNGQPRTADKLVTDLNTDPNGDNRFTWPEDFPFFGNGMNAYHIAPPGRKPAGVARWGHHDMAGNLVEWTADVVGEDSGVLRGGSWEGHPDKNTLLKSNYPLDRTYGSVGFRCAYGPAPVDKPETPKSASVVIHRARSAVDHLFGATPGEGAPAYAPEGVAFRVFADAPAAGSAPLHRCRQASGMHFLSTDAKCEGHIDEGRLGFVRTTAAPRLMTLYRCVKDGGADHISTVTPDDCAPKGYILEGSQGFVSGPPPSDFIASMYKKALGREPEMAGHVGWLTLVKNRRGCNAETLATVIEGVADSAEFNKLDLTVDERINRLYRSALGREPDPEGAANAKQLLQSGAATWTGIVRGAATSPEAASYAPARCAP